MSDSEREDDQQSEGCAAVLSRVEKAKYELCTEFDGSVTHSDVDKSSKELWLYKFPSNFDTAAFASVELKVPAHPQPGHLVSKFTMGKKKESYQLMECSLAECDDMVALVPDDEKQSLVLAGKPFMRVFSVLRDIEVPGEALEPPKVVRHPSQPTGLRPEFMPIGHVDGIPLKPLTVAVLKSANGKTAIKQEQQRSQRIKEAAKLAATPHKPRTAPKIAIETPKVVKKEKKESSKKKLVADSPFTPAASSSKKSKKPSVKQEKVEVEVIAEDGEGAESSPVKRKRKAEETPKKDDKDKKDKTKSTKKQRTKTDE